MKFQDPGKQNQREEYPKTRSLLIWGETKGSGEILSCFTWLGGVKKQLMRYKEEWAPILQKNQGPKTESFPPVQEHSIMSNRGHEMF